MTAPQIPADYEAWRQGRREEIAGANGKAKVAANAKITDPGPHTLPGIPGEWRTTEAGDLTVTAQAADGVQVAGSLVDGTSPVPSGSTLEFPDNRVGFASGADGSYGLVVVDQGRLERTGLTGIDSGSVRGGRGGVGDIRPSGQAEGADRQVAEGHETSRCGTRS
ncbi:hypothetical protein [Nonomuraea dietziae]|uniref:Uncharacterized protein (DUF1684 family) n=1 Tax=Nonomuraea dietziae TaxID=65515 RepID=A0A7W5VFR8_9ACTN|nr:hypothetical protein [Nonomuraea dietziae]MBB3732830.1 uncharacterized protein (DUF1684 family) [Nonomuraea dietziae]